jgi:hypothetical protein
MQDPSLTGKFCFAHEQKLLDFIWKPRPVEESTSHCARRKVWPKCRTGPLQVLPEVSPIPSAR